MKRKVFIGTVPLVMLVFMGCASYSPSLVRLNRTGPDVSKKCQGDLVVYVDEYAEEEKSKRAFDTNLADNGVLAVLLLVENSGTQSYEVKASDMTICEGTSCLKPLSPEAAAAKAKRNATGRAIGWSLIVPIISIPIAAVASASHTRDVNRHMAQDFSAKGFSDGALLPKKERSGFLFFQLDRARKDLRGLCLEASARNVNTGEIRTITLPLPDATVRRKTIGSGEGINQEVP
jgi:hypothetical protein